MAAVLILLPLVLIAGAALAAWACIRRSSLRIESGGVEVRNYPQPPRLVPLAEVERFEDSATVGGFASVRPKTAVLVLTDGSRLPVRRIDAPDAGYGVDALNERLARLRSI